VRRECVRAAVGIVEALIKTSETEAQLESLARLVNAGINCGDITERQRRWLKMTYATRLKEIRDGKAKVGRQEDVR